ncbi:MAG: hypothetical protein MR707_06205 [Galactobacillus timonensis]|uniref:hypothetical protein n=1 Tax=Galactobacillus timonensis TaxID=2041840 RepID=UPI0023F4EF03|nr:hypothetical protein [Galactobacillus timonensis]MCI6067805.1 hypothetical protein [Galactobacillus timonensis]
MEDPQLRAQLTTLMVAVVTVPAFWEFIKWLFSTLFTLFTGRKRATTEDISNSVKLLMTESSEMRADIRAIKEEARAHNEENLEEHAKSNRSKILRFDDELRIGIRHSYEYFEDILRTVKEYEDYCDSHPKFKNRQAESAIKHIQEAYDEAHENNTFI